MHGLIVKLAQETAKRCGGDPRDYVQAGALGFLEALNNFRPGKAKLVTFAYYRIRGAMLDARRDHGQDIQSEETSDAVAEAVADDGLDVAALRRAVHELPALERSVIMGRLAGHNQEEAGAVAGVSKSWASRLEGRALALLKEQLV
jgi:RNA polymerase sigma factor (sigma-70 family)